METFSDWTDRLNGKQKEVLYALRDFEIERITWDMDQVLACTDIPVRKRVGMTVGMDYNSRILEEYGDIERWLMKDFEDVPEDLASRLSWFYWSYGPCLAEAPVNPEAQRYSQLAAISGVEQYIVTGRRASLATTTNEWVSLNLPWIDQANIKITKNNIDKFDPMHKISTLDVLHPDVHFEDSVNDIEKILKEGLDTQIIWFARPKEYGSLSHEKVIPVPSMAAFANFMN